MLSSYLKKLDLLIEVANKKELEEMFRKEASQLITIKDMSALFGLSISHSGKLAGMLNSNYCRPCRKCAEELERFTAERRTSREPPHLLL